MFGRPAELFFLPFFFPPPVLPSASGCSQKSGGIAEASRRPLIHSSPMGADTRVMSKWKWRFLPRGYHPLCSRLTFETHDAWLGGGWSYSKPFGNPVFGKFCWKILKILSVASQSFSEIRMPPHLPNYPSYGYYARGWLYVHTCWTVNQKVFPYHYLLQKICYLTAAKYSLTSCSSCTFFNFFCYRQQPISPDYWPRAIDISFFTLFVLSHFNWHLLSWSCIFGSLPLSPCFLKLFLAPWSFLRRYKFYLWSSKVF